MGLGIRGGGNPYIPYSHSTQSGWCDLLNNGTLNIYKGIID